MTTLKKQLPKLSAVATVVAAALAFGVHASQITTQDLQLKVEQNARSAEQIAALKSVDTTGFPTYYIVQLEGDPLAVRFGDERDAVRASFDSSAAQSYRQQLVRQQDEVAQRLQRSVSGLSVERGLQTLGNLLIVSHNGNQDVMAQLSAVEGVKRVFENTMSYAQMDASNSLINAPEVWDLIGSRDDAGEGIKVAVIDGGINSGHAMFQANGHARPEGLPNDDYCATVDPGFCNDKLVVARYYTPTFNLPAGEVLTPEDTGGHGTHVAGTAVGNHVAINYEGVDVSFSGVAPGASLMVYKGLFGGSGSAVMLIQALEDAVNDGAHVINNSWGGGAGGNPQDSLYTGIFEAAEAAGVVVVTAAGNFGPGANTIGCPACAEPGLAVANTVTGRFFASSVDAAGETGIVAFQGMGDFTIDQPITAPLMPVSAILPEADDDDEEVIPGDEAEAGSPLACEALPAGSLDGHIALVSRGECSFGEKAENVQNAGAVGMILWNTENAQINMVMDESTLPSVSVFLDDGVRILEALAANDGVGEGTIYPKSAQINDEFVDIMSGLSSRGPNGDASFLKPDIAAPGTDILSAIQGPNDAYSSLYSGTSMASPHVAGAAALIRQLRPELDAFQVKSVLMTSSNPSVRKQDAETAADAFDIGAGRLDIAAAVNTAVSFDTASIASTSCIIECTFERTVTNISGESITLNGDFYFPNGRLAGSLSADPVTLDAGASATFRVTVDARMADEGWDFGHLIWSDASGNYADARLPIAVYASGASDRQTLDTTVISGESVVGEPITLRNILRDGDLGDFNVTMINRVPAGAEMDVDSAMVRQKFASNMGISIDPNGRHITWSGELNSGTPGGSITPISFPYAGMSLKDISDEYVEVCGVDQYCDEVSLTLSLGELFFVWDNEQVNTISVSENGFLAVGEQNVALQWQPRQLPDGQAPNGVLAPFWSDFESGDVSGASMLFDIVLDDNEEPWLVWEWNQMVEWWSDESSPKHTFSIWIKLFDDTVVFNYVDLESTPSDLSVGVEGTLPTAGTSMYFRGTGTAPSNGDSWLAAADSALGFIEFTYDIQVDEFGSTANASAGTVQNEAVTVDMKDYATAETAPLISHVSATAPALPNFGIVGVDYNAYTPIFVNPVGTVTLEIVSEPENGTVALDDNWVATYTPDEDFYGDDSFTYQLVDEAGNTSATSTVSVTVEYINQAPTAVASASETSVVAGDTVTLSAAGSSDPDGDALTYSWTQVSGVAVSLQGANSATASFTAPELVRDVTVTFQLTVSDGELSDTATVNVTIEPPAKSSKKWYEGSFGGLIVLFGLPLVYLRRRMVAKK